MRAYVQQSTLDSVQVMRIRLMQLCTTMHILTHPHTKFLHHMDQQGSWSARIPFTPLNTRVTCQTKVTYSASHPCSPPSLDMLLPATALCTGTEITIVHSNKAFRISSGPAPEQVWDMQPPPVLTNTPPFFQCLIGPQPPTEDCCEKIS